MEARGRAWRTSRTKVLVIGAGQAGLAAAHELKKSGIDFLLVDAGHAVGHSWRRRYDALTLFTPRSISSLPGMSQSRSHRSGPWRLPPGGSGNYFPNAYWAGAPGDGSNGWVFRALPTSLVGRGMRRVDPFPNRGTDDGSLARIGIEIRPRLTSVDGSSAVFSDGTRMDPDAIVWATGYVEDFGWIAIDGVADSDGMILQREGVSPVPDLYFLGRPWRRNRASALIAGAGDDAAVVIARIGSMRASQSHGR